MLCRVMEALEPIPADTGQGRVTPWTSSQFITELTYREKLAYMLTFTPTGNLESQINQTCISWTVGGSLRTHRDPTQIREKHANFTQRVLRQLGIKPRTFLLCEATVLTAKPLCCPVKLQTLLPVICGCNLQFLNNRNS